MPVSEKNVTKKKIGTLVVLRIGTHPIVFSVLFMVVVGALVFFVAIVPMVRSLQPGGKASVVDALARNSAALNTLNAEKKLADTASSLSSEDRATLAYALPQEADIPGLAVIFKTIAERSGLKMTSFDASEPPVAGGEGTAGVGQVEITLSLDLITYEKLKIFLVNTEESLRIFDIKGFTFSPSTGSTGIQFKSYYLSGA